MHTERIVGNKWSAEVSMTDSTDDATAGTRVPQTFPKYGRESSDYYSRIRDFFQRSVSRARLRRL